MPSSFRTMITVPSSGQLQSPSTRAAILGVMLVQWEDHAPRWTPRSHVRVVARLHPQNFRPTLRHRWLLFLSLLRSPHTTNLVPRTFPSGNSASTRFPPSKFTGIILFASAQENNAGGSVPITT